MLLDRIDIDVHGPLHRVELGPFSGQLNVICGPNGSGKTAIARFVRDSLVGRQYPLGMMSSSTGRIVWADRNGMVHCLREKDGTSGGRTSVEFEPRDEQSHSWDGLRHSWISGICNTTERSRATASITLPESLVDGVITDTAITNVSRVVAACVHSGLDNPDTYREVPIDPSPAGPLDSRDLPPGSSQPRSLRAQLADVEAEIARLRSQPQQYQSLIHRRDQLHTRLARGVDRSGASNGHHFVDREDAQHRLTELCEQARDLRSRQSELRRWLAAIDERPNHPHADLDPYHRSVDAIRSSTVDPSSQRAARTRELDRVNCELDVCLAEAAEIRRWLRVEDDDRHRSSADQWTDPDAIRSELKRIDQQLAQLSRLDWLQSRRRHLVSQLNSAARPSRALSPLSAAASRWLVRLSAGRLRRIDWPQHWITAPVSDKNGFADARTGVQIDGRDEFNCPAADRALAVMAVRMAAGDLLFAKGRQLPLVLETHGQLLDTSRLDGTGDGQAFNHEGHLGQTNHAIASALSDYVTAGRQVIVLTSHEELATQIARSGGRTFRIHAQRVVHPHRPLWKPHYSAESYVGPHPHTYGYSTAPTASPRPIVDINRDFDVAWREAYGLNDAPDGRTSPDRRSSPASSIKTDDAAAGTQYRDGYFFADTFTTVATPHHFEFDEQGNWVSSGEVDRPSHAATVNAATVNAATVNAATVNAAPVNAGLTDGIVADVAASPSPFFLSVDSPIDQAPSIDAVAAARLRGLSVTHINHLMQQDSNRLADALGLASVSASTIRRWQAECRLVCRVPQLRGFDARVLVGCGVTEPAQLAAIHPADLLQEVEAFLATERGQRILLSGSSQELSRITCWIAAANSSPAERAVAEARNQRDDYGRSASGEHSFDALQGRRFVYGDGESGRGGTGRRTRRRAARSARRSPAETRSSSINTGVGDSRSAGRRRRGSGNTATPGDGQRNTQSRRRRGRTSPSQTRDPNLVRFGHEARDQKASESRHQRDDTADSWRFYLHRDSPVVDAPSIGARMAGRLEAIEIHTVNDLLTADPDTVAAELNHRRVDSDVVLQWQQQAELVCRVPMLRGHDAQLLVIAELTTPEELAAADAEELFQRIDPISRSGEGGRVLRGGKLPDLNEVNGWIQFAQHTRELVAA
jgi:hypothetical protein